ncbi:class I SAM-dependent methyltransferase [Deferribacter autotrophicus]|uniref:Class I SAM-dependent methyltransferase n=1 Tax=Deferribacter autotrophicus TaxID=500465 RepID=A0A5A8F2F4_9BACT|nr:DUF6094 domain-containing protein [Deferribacter autotrophicus]KAA0257548.1 class I SAM-dependent methyltransferase [Deferribacter autotrophicus]
MARLESQKKMGYYPTPKEVVEQIRELLSFSAGARCLDTCCGTGEALATLTKNAPVRTYGVELDKERAITARQKLYKVLNCDALYETRITNNAFDLLFLNPPYDWDVKENETENSEKTEKKFLQFHLRYLNTKGVIIYVIPFLSLKYTYRFFLRMKNLRVLAFPEELYKQFKQIVIIGKSTPFADKELINNNRNMLKNIINMVDSERAYETLWTTESILTSDYRPLYEVEANTVELKTFSSTRIDPEDAIEQLKNSVVYTEFNKLTKIQKVEEIRPLAMLRNGHLAMLLASGIMNGRLKNNKYDLIVKGSIKSYMEKTDSDYDEEKASLVEKSVKKYQIVVRSLDLKKLRFIEIK